MANVDLEVAFWDDKPICVSDCIEFGDWAQLKVHEGMRFKVAISSHQRPANLREYRLIVVGSTDHVRHTDISGAHQIEYVPLST